MPRADFGFAGALDEDVEIGWEGGEEREDRGEKAFRRWYGWVVHFVI